MPDQFRQLDPTRLLSTAEKIADETEKTFPASGISNVAKEVVATTRTTFETAADLARPRWGIRIIAAVATLFLLAWPLLLSLLFDFKDEAFSSLGDFIEATDAGLHLILVVAAGIAFTITWESRLKRKLALESITELRSLAHIIDMHQITKDPGIEHITPLPEGTEDTRTVRSDHQLALYLDFSSDLLAIIGKLAAYYIQHLRDRAVLDAVNEIETLTNGLSQKLWQKVMIINHMAESRREKTRDRRAPVTPKTADNQR